MLWTEALDHREMNPLHSLAEPRQHGRQDRQRPEYGYRNNEDRGRTESFEGRITGKEQPGHRDHHGEPGDEHRAAGGRGGDLERFLRALALPALFTFALQVEHRVVDAHGETDQEDERADA